VKASRTSQSFRRQREPACSSCRGAGTGAKCEARCDRSAPARRAQRAGHSASPHGAAARTERTSRSPRRQREPACDSCRGSRTGARCEARGNRSAPARRAQRADHGASLDGAAVQADRTLWSLRRQRGPACSSCRGSRTDARCEARGNRSAPARRAQQAGHGASPDGAAVNASRTLQHASAAAGAGLQQLLRFTSWRGWKARSNRSVSAQRARRVDLDA
jgi:hypothetical protein